MNEINKILEALAGLDLSKYPEKQVKNLLSNVGTTAAIKTTLHAGKTILRARLNHNRDRFTKISEISYKPAEFNKEYQRASTPSNTMFYGSTISETVKLGELELPRVIGLFEAVPLMRDLSSSGEQVITYSSWTVTKDIELLSIIHHQDFKRENSWAVEQRAYYEKFIAGLPQEIAENTRLINDFMAKEFAKAITPKDYDYLISAVYTEMLVAKSKVAGVMYPSVRTGGEGFNVAIHPYFVENHMVPTFVGECTIYKNKEHIILDNNTGALLLDPHADFELKPLIPELQMGKEAILKELYPEKSKGSLK